MRRLISIFCSGIILCSFAMTTPVYAGTEVKEEQKMIAAGKTVKFDYVLTVDGQKVDSSQNTGPLEYVQGEGKIIKGLEKQMEGLKVGDHKSVVVAAAEAYGEVKPDAFKEVPKAEFPENIPLKEGQMISVGTPEGGSYPAVIDKVSEGSVVLNFNHPLAGKELHFEVTVVEII
ncbi:MAG: peptidylprolyl isomerase [Candidatus Omnitrophota bacterium]